MATFDFSTLYSIETSFISNFPDTSWSITTANDAHFAGKFVGQTATFHSIPLSPVAYKVPQFVRDELPAE